MTLNGTTTRTKYRRQLLKKRLYKAEETRNNGNIWKKLRREVLEVVKSYVERNNKQKQFDEDCETDVDDNESH